MKNLKKNDLFNTNFFIIKVKMEETTQTKNISFYNPQLTFYNPPLYYYYCGKKDKTKIFISNSCKYV